MRGERSLRYVVRDIARIIYLCVPRGILPRRVGRPGFLSSVLGGVYQVCVCLGSTVWSIACLLFLRPTSWGQCYDDVLLCKWVWAWFRGRRGDRVTGAMTGQPPEKEAFPRIQAGSLCHPVWSLLFFPCPSPFLLLQCQDLPELHVD